jgi:hypothetical protein
VCGGAGVLLVIPLLECAISIFLFLRRFFMKSMKVFAQLVNYACSGEMERRDVSSTVAELKSAKSAVLRDVADLETKEERQAVFAQLHTLMYRLYKAIAVVYIVNEIGDKTVTENLYVSVSTMANMILCY